jgi:hypothetical protein
MFIVTVDVEACSHTIVAWHGIGDVSTASSFAFLGQGYDFLVSSFIEFCYTALRYHCSQPSSQAEKYSIWVVPGLFFRGGSQGWVWSGGQQGESRTTKGPGRVLWTWMLFGTGPWPCGTAWLVVAASSQSLSSKTKLSIFSRKYAPSYTARGRHMIAGANEITAFSTEIRLTKKHSHDTAPSSGIRGAEPGTRGHLWQNSPSQIPSSWEGNVRRKSKIQIPNSNTQNTPN